MSANRTPLLDFLPLGPVTSASFPKSQQAQPAGAEHKRRSSSLSSQASQASEGKLPSYRVLKVAPVHFGEHSGDHKDDWHEVAVVE